MDMRRLLASGANGADEKIWKSIIGTAEFGTARRQKYGLGCLRTDSLRCYNADL